MEKLVREIFAELAIPPILVFPNWDVVADGSRPFHVYCDDCIAGFGASLDQEQSGGSTKPIAYITRAALDSERQGTPLGFGRRQHRLGSQTRPRLPLGRQIPNILRPKGIGKHRQSEEPQCTSPAVARVLHCVRLHTRVPQRQRERQRRLPVTLDRSCHGA